MVNGIIPVLYLVFHRMDRPMSKLATTLLFFVLSLIAIGDAHAQSKEEQFVDSASAVLPSLPTDTHKVNLLFDLAYNSRYFDRQRAMEFARQGKELSVELE